MPDPKPKTAVRPPLVLGPDAEFRGLVVLRQSARLEGCVYGELLSAGRLWLGEHARVEGSVEGDDVTVAGRVEGRLAARQRLELLATARVAAEVEAPRVALSEGAVLEGRCSTPQPAPAPPKSAAPS